MAPINRNTSEGDRPPVGDLERALHVSHTAQGAVGVSWLLELQTKSNMPNGGHLTVATTMHTHDGRDAASGVPGEYVRMVVADTGGGMSAAAQSRLFEPFFANEDAGRSAMGLAKVDAIVKQAGGRIQAETDLDAVRSRH